MRIGRANEVLRRSGFLFVGAMLAAALISPPSARAADDALRFDKFRGPKASVAQKQLAKAICESAECIIPKKGSASKARRTAAVLSGSVEKQGKTRVLELVLSGPDGDERLRKEVQLEAKGALAEADLEAVTDEVLRRLAPSASTSALASAAQPAPPPPAKVAVQAAAAVPAAAPAAVPITASAAIRREPAPPPAAVAQTRASAPPPRPAPEARPLEDRATLVAPAASPVRGEPRFAVSVAFEALRRDFAIDGLARGEVADSHSIGYFPMPAVRLAVYPWSDREGALRRLSFTGAFAYGAGVSSKVYDHAASAWYPKAYSHTYLHGEGAADFALPLSDSLSLNLFGGLSLTQLRTGAEEGSNHLAGLPNVGFFGPKGGVGLGWQSARLRVWGSASALYAMSSGAIVSEDYFTEGSTVGLEGIAGVALRAGPAELSLRGTYTRYALTFEGSATDAYQADGASDQYLVASAGLGFQF